MMYKKYFLILIIECVILAVLGASYYRYKDSSYKGMVASPKTTLATDTISVEPAMALVEQKKKRDERLAREIQGMIAEMTQEEKVAQLMILTNPKDIKEGVLAGCTPGGIIFFGIDYQGKRVDQVRTRVDALQSCVKIPMFVGVDEEGGKVSRISGMVGEGIPVFESARNLCGTRDMEWVYKKTEEKISFLQEMGMNLNFDPVADVVTKEDAYMYERSAGGEEGIVSDYVTTVIKAMKDKKMYSCVKHFPGYGNNANTHTTYVRDNRGLQEYRDCDFLPFLAGISEGADMVMVSHLVMEAVDGEAPASLSRPVHDLLREELQYDGVILADDLNMGAIRGGMSLDVAAGKAFAAGNDMIFSADYSLTRRGALQALQQGLITEEQLDESLERVLRLKAAYGLLEFEQ